MDLLKPGHAHRSSSDRLLSNYLDSQKSLSQSLLSLLSHSHSSTSSLLAYVTSSPGVLLPIRKSVRHSGFEGPLTGPLLEAHGSQLGSIEGAMDETQGWASYILASDGFRKDLKQIHLLEEEMSRVKRDREILVSRLIKNTKSRPTKSDLNALANEIQASGMSSRGSTASFTSNGSASTKEGKRAGKLAEAQAELLGCEEHLRSLEVKIEQERNKVMVRGLEERFRAMEAVGRMWVTQAKRGLDDLDKIHVLPADAYELDDNLSVAPSQSASQTGRADSDIPQASKSLFPKNHSHHLNLRIGPPSVGSVPIQEEDEDGSDNTPPATKQSPATQSGQRMGKYVVHENSRFGRSGGAVPMPPSSSPRILYEHDSEDEAPKPNNARAGGRRAASDVGAMGYKPIVKRQSLKRANSVDRKPPPIVTEHSNSSRGSLGNYPVKKKGFFASIGKWFKNPNKGSSRRDSGSVVGRDSPAFGTTARNRDGWSTRTDQNLKRAGSSAGGYGGGGRGGSSAFGGSMRRRKNRSGGDDSSSDDGQPGFMSIQNNRNTAAYAVENVGRGPINNRKPVPVASGLIPAAPRGFRSDSQSTITKQPKAKKTVGAGSAGGVSRSNTVKSGMSNNINTKSTGSAVKRSQSVNSGAGGNRKILNNQPATKSNNMMNLVSPSTGRDPNSPEVPIMPEVPKAPKSQVFPKMELAKAPGSSIVRPGDPPRPDILGKDEIFPHQSISRSNSISKVPQVNGGGVTQNPDDGEGNLPARPPSRLLAPPKKSALRPSSSVAGKTGGGGGMERELGPPIDPPKTLISVTAPGPVQVPRETVPPPSSFPIGSNQRSRPRPDTRQSYASTAEEGMSVYESANEGNDIGRAPRGAGQDESSSDESEAGDKRYTAVENKRIQNLGINVGPPKVEKIANEQYSDDDDSDGGDDEDDNKSIDTELARNKGNRPRAVDDLQSKDVNRKRKSVKIQAPGSPLNASDQNLVRQQAEAAAALQVSDSAPLRTTVGSNGAAGVDNKWSTRIGHMREDTSEEEDEDEDYVKAKKGLIKNPSNVSSSVKKK